MEIRSLWSVPMRCSASVSGADRAAQLDDLPLEQVDALDVGVRHRREDVLFHRVDVGFDQIGDVEVAVHDVVGDRVHDRVGTEFQERRRGVQPLAHPGQPAVLAVADRDDEVGADEDHDLAGLDDLAGQGHGFVFDVVDGLEDQEQRLVVALQLRPLMGVHRVLDGQLVQAEHVGDGLHLVLVGFVQADPDERLLTLAFRARAPCSVRRRGCTCRVAACHRSRCRSRPWPAPREREWTWRPGWRPWPARLVEVMEATRETMASRTSRHGRAFVRRPW